MTPTLRLGPFRHSNPLLVHTLGRGMKPVPRKNPHGHGENVHTLQTVAPAGNQFFSHRYCNEMMLNKSTLSEGLLYLLPVDKMPLLLSCFQINV